MASLSRQVMVVTLDDGTEHKVTTTNADQIAYEQTRARHKWPTLDAGGVATWWTFLAWRALKREGVTAATYETFRDQVCVDIDNLTNEDDLDVDPTPPDQQYD